MTTRIILRDILVASMPKSLVHQMLEDIPRCYKEASKHWEGLSILGEPEKRNLMPHLRRGLIETQFRNGALDAGLAATVEKTETESSEYTLVRANGVEFTVSKTDRSSALPESCRFRCQRSDANDLLQQGQLFPVSLSDNKEKKTTYAIITHGPRLNDPSEVAFINIGFPSPDMSAWAEPPRPLIEIYDRIVQLDEERNDDREQIQPVKPRLRPGIKRKPEDHEKES